MTFIRSTNLDTNWTWQQLRQMQLGGNARAGTFFRSHNCNTTDAQQKYNSRAASLYRDKLSQDAVKAMRLHGDKLHIDGGSDEVAEESKEADFFDSMSSDNGFSAPAPSAAPAKAEVKADEALGAPDVTLAVSNPAPAQPPPINAKKSTIGAKKGPSKKPGGLGGKKGLGAQKAVKDFAEIEREAEMADNIAVTRREEAVKSAEEQEAAAVSMRLAYQDLENQQKKKDQAMSKMDPKKAEQMERLGMGFGAGFGGPKSHSLLSDVGVIVQEEPNSARKASYQTSTKDNFFDDFEVVEKEDAGWGNSKSRIDDICAPSSGMNNSKPAWEQDLNENLSKLSTSKSSNWDNDFDTKPKRSAPVSSGGSSSSEAVSKFGNAKSISSDMFFGGESNSERDANLSRFQGSASISSDMYFNRDTGSGGAGGMRQSQSYYSNFQTPDMDDVKESVRQGVTKVAGRLSGMASGVMSSIQDKYGY